MEVMMAKNLSLSKLVSPVKIYPQVLLNVKVADREKAENDADVLAAVKRVEEKLNGDGRILYRASGTEPLIRIMVEAESERAAKTYAKQVSEVLTKKGYVV